MQGDFVSVFDVADCGYRGMPWLLVSLLVLVSLAVHAARLRPESRGEIIYRYCVLLVMVCGLIMTTVYHGRAYRQYRHLLQMSAAGQVATVTGNVTGLRWQDKSLFVDVDGRRLQVSAYEWPYRLGYHPDDFQLKPTFLLHVELVDEVIVRLEVHRANL